MADVTEEAGPIGLVLTMFNAVESGNPALFRSCFEPEAIVWHNTDQQEMTIEEVCEFLGFICAQSTSQRYEDRRILVAGNAIVVQQTMALELKSGKTMRCPVMVRVDISDNGLIARLEEYFDSRATDVLASIPGVPGATFPTE